MSHKRIRVCILFLSFIVTTLFAQSNWTIISPIPSGGKLNSVVWTGTQLVAVGKSGVIITNTPGQNFWTFRNSGTSRELFSIAWTGTRLVVGSDSGIILTSTDGITWAPCDSISGLGGKNSILSELFRKVIWTGTKCVILGLSQTVGSFFDNNIFTSSDGIIWQGSHIPSLVDSVLMNSIAWTGNQYVVVGNGEIKTSPDAITWTRRDTASPHVFYDVIWTGDQIVAVGYAKIITSKDGLYWSTGNMNFANRLFSVTSTGSQLVAVGIGDSILTSKDGISWSTKSLHTTLTLNSVICTGTHFVAVGSDASGGVIATSPVDPMATNGSIVRERRVSHGFRVSKSSFSIDLQGLGQGSVIHAVVYSFSGRKVMEANLIYSDGTVAIPIRDLPSGHYLAELTYPNRRTASRFSK